MHALFNEAIYGDVVMNLMDHNDCTLFSLSFSLYLKCRCSAWWTVIWIRLMFSVKWSIINNSTFNVLKQSDSNDLTNFGSQIDIFIAVN